MKRPSEGSLRSANSKQGILKDQSSCSIITGFKSEARSLKTDCI